MFWIRRLLKFLVSQRFISKEEGDIIEPFLIIIFEDNPIFLNLNLLEILDNFKNKFKDSGVMIDA